MDTNRITTIEELEVGDEILVSSNAQMRYYKIVRKPTLNPKNPNRWKGVKCSECITIEKRNRYVRQVGYKQVDVDIHICTPENHNNQKLVYGLNWRDMWLVKREGM